MTKSSISAVVAIFLSLLFPGLAQEETLKPKEPVTPRAPERAYWKVTTRFKNSPVPQEGDKPRNSVRTLRKEGKLIQEVMELDGKRFESYIVGALRIGDHGEKDTVTSISPTDAAFAYYGDADYARMEWLSMKYFAGVAEHEGRQVFVFRISGDDPAAVVPGEAVAMLDVKTQLPVTYFDDQIEENYEFMSLPTSPLVIPDHFKKRLVKELQYRQDLQRAGGG